MQLAIPGNRQLNLARPAVMGILNITPDSFSDGGKHAQLNDAIREAQQMLVDGATVLDVGGESTRPGAAEVPLQQELDRVIPVIEALRQRFDCIISIDTSKAAVMSAAVQAGADMINDVRALQEPDSLQTAVALRVPVCLMHMQGAPRTMQHAPMYQDVVADVTEFLVERADQCIAGGLSKEQIILDPGFGFGKSLQHNYLMLRHFASFTLLGYPVLAGISRKSMIGQLLNVDINERLAGSLTCATIAALNGARLIRVHDVKETVQALRIVTAVQDGV